MASKTTHTVRNTQKAVRGFYDGDTKYHELAPGASVEGVPMTKAAYDNVKSTGYFEFDGEAPTDEAEGGNADADGLPETKAELEALATAEGIDLSTIAGTGANGNVLKADIVAAIEAKRAGGQPSDDLDEMSDADLLDTVKVLTGQDAPAGATREQLLALARGEQPTE